MIEVAGAVAMVGAVTDLALYTRRTRVSVLLPKEAPPMPGKNDPTSRLQQIQDTGHRLKTSVSKKETERNNIANWYCWYCGKCPLQEKRTGMRSWDSGSEKNEPNTDVESLLSTHSEKSEHCSVKAPLNTRCDVNNLISETPRSPDVKLICEERSRDSSTTSEPLTVCAYCFYKRYNCEKNSSSSSSGEQGNPARKYVERLFRSTPNTVTTCQHRSVTSLDLLCLVAGKLVCIIQLPLLSALRCHRTHLSCHAIQYTTSSPPVPPMTVNWNQALVVTTSLALVTAAIAALTVLFLKATSPRRTTMLVTCCLTTLLGSMFWTLEGGDAAGFAVVLLPFAFSVGATLGFYWEHTMRLGGDKKTDTGVLSTRSIIRILVTIGAWIQNFPSSRNGADQPDTWPSYWENDSLPGESQPLGSHEGGL